MSPGHVDFFTYLWHYLVARLLYDGLLRPVLHAPGAALMAVLVCGCVCAAALIRTRHRRRSGRRRPR